MARLPPGTELDALIGQYQHLSNLPRGDEALHTLRKIGSMVKPIMRQRSWHVGTLAEFYPDERNLLGLNINHGQKINLRLRYPGDSNQFLPFEQVLDTMLHELCHNAIGPHNQQFHALWDQLRDEQESLMRKGYTGEGFLGRGQALGGRRLPLHEASRLARQAAEQRRIAAERAKGSGQRLGGSGIMRGQDARQIIADAVERRIRIERGCASGTEMGDRVAFDEAAKGSIMTTTKAGPEDEDDATMMQAYIDLIQEEERQKFGGFYNPPSAENPAGPRGNPQGQSLLEQQREIEQNILKQKDVNRSKQPLQKPKSPAPPRPDASSPTIRAQPTKKPAPATSPEPPQPSPQLDLTTWTCEICTLINSLTYLTCDACGVERPAWISNALNASMSTSQSIPSTAAKKPVHNALKPRSSAYDSIARFNAAQAEKISKGPIGWTCACGNFMEAEWWTCARCGRLKDAS